MKSNKVFQTHIEFRIAEIFSKNGKSELVGDLFDDHTVFSYFSQDLSLLRNSLTSCFYSLLEGELFEILGLIYESFSENSSNEAFNLFFSYLERKCLEVDFKEYLNSRPKADRYKTEIPTAVDKIHKYHNKVIVGEVRVYDSPLVDEVGLEEIGDIDNFRVRTFIGKLMLLNDFDYYIVPMNTKVNSPDMAKCVKIRECNEVYELKTGDIIWSSFL